ncbi:MAG: diaminobutyrate acetyltransferase [Hahellaceae bacterium]|nr:diaminobutyrate acetyltransferase [Hahellaceae bacterium]MCP5168184.1 diaminobutyrate acetyltransferase [Hahellaceae bacterium]
MTITLSNTQGAAPNESPGSIHSPQKEITLCVPESTDGAAVHALIANTPPLDPNSLYCNLLQCTHFAQSSIKAMTGDTLVGFISGYRLPESPETLFIWQVAVAEQARGKGLAKQMLLALIRRLNTHHPVAHLETTITPDNLASWSLFKSLAASLNAPWQSEVMFGRQTHFQNLHDEELVMRIGPFCQPE